MLRYRILCLLLSSCLFACSPSYMQMQSAKADVNDLKKFKPVFTSALYNTLVDVTGNHLSGLLLIKKMPDSTTRMVFSNEMGFKFFDFEFGANGSFKVYSIIKKMNKKAVIKTLRKNFQLVMMEPMDYSSVTVRKQDGLIYYIFPQEKGYNYYITDSTGSQLIRMERASKRKTVVEAIMQNYKNGVPDTIGISHKTFNFTIGLKRIER